MTPLLQLTIPGDPVAKGRPRFSTRSGFARTYTPAETLSAENWVRSCALQAMAGLDGFPLDCPLVLRATFMLAKPKKPKHREAPCGRPDTDNYVKLLLDGMQLAGVFVDDSRVVRVEAEKCWTDGEPHTFAVLSRLTVATTDDRPARIRSAALKFLERGR